MSGRGLLEFRADRRSIGHVVQRHGPRGFDFLLVPGACRRRRGKPWRLFQRRNGPDAGTKPPRHDAPQRAGKPDRDGGLVRADQSRLDGGDRQRRRDRLSGGKLPGRGLREFRADCGSIEHVVQQHGPRGFHFLLVPGARHRRCGEPWRLFQHRHGLDTPRLRHGTSNRACKPDGDSGGVGADQSYVDGGDR